MISHALKVRKEEAEKIRKKLLDDGILQRNLKIRRDGDYVYFPVSKKCDYGEFIEKMEFEEEKREDYIEIAKKEGIKIDSISIDFIGDIAIIRLPPHLQKMAGKIADALMRANKRLKTVCLDRGVESEYRIRKLEVIKGDKTETVHKEYGLKMVLDVARVYFSPRLATERMRVAKMVEKGSIVIDMFAGVAPFSLVIAKYAHPEKIYAIDINEDAIKYAKINVKLNHLEDRIEIIHGDAKEVIKNLPYADHIIMNLPHKSFDFLPHAIKKGKIIHYYEIMERGKEKERMEEIKKLCSMHGKKAEIKNFHIVGSYSPAKIKAGMDIFIV